jgi:anti-sigma28 factor (negative regulator of flagellin synthesis)
MQINGKNRIDPTTSGATPGAADRSGKLRAPEAAESKTERTREDSVSFSDEARALSSGTSTKAAASPERIDDVRQRVLMGAYNTAEMAGEVAKRILQRGDL